MVSIWLLAFLSNVFFVGAFEYDDNVLVLTPDNFNSTLQEHNFLMVKFYAPWCGHCKTFAPEYNIAAKRLRDEGSKVVLAKLDATIDHELAKQLDIRGYPTVKYFLNQEPFDYNGNRTADAIVSWCKRMSGLSFIQLNNSDEVENFVSSQDITVILFSKESDKESLTDFDKIGKKLDNVGFGVVHSMEIMKKFDIVKTPSVLLFKNFDKSPVTFDEDSLEGLESFIRIECVPLVFHYSPTTTEALFNSPVKKIVIVFMTEDDVNKLEPLLKIIGEKFKSKVHIMVVIYNDQNVHVLEHFRMKDEVNPTYLLVDFSEDYKKYKPDSVEWSEDSISSVVKDFVAGNLVPFYLSENIPEKQTHPVLTLVGKNYAQIVNDTLKTVFVMHYAPWCGHCKQLSPIWDQLGEEYSNSDDVIIAKIDMTTNEVENLEIKSFPTLKLYPKGPLGLVDYNGDRTLTALKAFVESGGVGAHDDSETDKKGEEDTVKDEL